MLPEHGVVLLRALSSIRRYQRTDENKIGALGVDDALLQERAIRVNRRAGDSLSCIWEERSQVILDDLYVSDASCLVVEQRGAHIDEATQNSKGNAERTY